MSSDAEDVVFEDQGVKVIVDRESLRSSTAPRWISSNRA